MGGFTIVFLGLIAPKQVNATDCQQAAPSAKRNWVIQSNCYSAMLLNMGCT
jgi:hypothetical protein